MSDRPKILARIRALRAKAADSAASEAEAQAAAEAAAKLLMRFDVDEAELSEPTRDGFTYGATGRDHLDTVDRFLSAAIGKLTETFPYHRDGETVFAGDAPDVEMALYLAELFRGTITRGWMTAYAEAPMAADPERWRATEGNLFDLMDAPRTRPRAKRHDMTAFREGFEAGFVERMRSRLYALADERAEAHATRGSTALAVAKQEMIRRRLAEDGLRFEKGGRRRSLNPGSRAGRDAGRAAGDRIGLGRPVNAGASGPRALPT